MLEERCEEFVKEFEVAEEHPREKRIDRREMGALLLLPVGSMIYRFYSEVSGWVVNARPEELSDEEERDEGEERARMADANRILSHPVSRGRASTLSFVGFAKPNGVTILVFGYLRLVSPRLHQLQQASCIRWSNQSAA